ncbi:carboxymuconolactone decarboxylase family protein [Sphingomonas flavalba]|uniref:carboxymuconolactone decarboxylase family protein n=1 Tax=Sphingomonas flavalba TaxID=2559804 RepID=UPI00109DB0B7|nr:carboxymuconolactone decarboxylase family protein [Sphingomonas flavalba]
MSETAAPRYEQEVPDVLKAMANTQAAITAHGLPRLLHHLVVLRASQINRCAFCVKMHTREAREDGETSERLDRLVVWDQVSDFTAGEKAALAWTEALTVLDHKTDLGALRAELRRHFSEGQVATLSATVAMINLWNRIGISRH